MVQLYSSVLFISSISRLNSQITFINREQFFTLENHYFEVEELI